MLSITITHYYVIIIVIVIDKTITITLLPISGFGFRIYFYTFWYKNQQMFKILNTHTFLGLKNIRKKEKNFRKFF